MRVHVGYKVLQGWTTWLKSTSEPFNHLSVHYMGQIVIALMSTNYVETNSSSEPASLRMRDYLKWRRLNVPFSPLAGKHLVNKIKRAMFVARMWSKADTPNPSEDLIPEAYGWRKRTDGYSPILVPRSTFARKPQIFFRRSANLNPDDVCWSEPRRQLRSWRPWGHSVSWVEWVFRGSGWILNKLVELILAARKQLHTQYVDAAIKAQSHIRCSTFKPPTSPREKPPFPASTTLPHHPLRTLLSPLLCTQQMQTHDPHLWYGHLPTCHQSVHNTWCEGPLGESS